MNKEQQQPSLAALIPCGAIEAKVREWLAEDIPSFEFGGFVVGDKEEEAVLLGKADGLLAGVPFFNAVFREVHCTVEWHLKEGAQFQPVVEVPPPPGGGLGTASDPSSSSVSGRSRSWPSA